MEVNVEIVLSYNDEETDWKVKKNISKFIYRLKKYRTGNRFSGEYTYKINQDSELYKQIIEFYKSNRKDVEFICLDYDVKVSDEEFEKAKAFVLCFPEYYCEEYEDIENEYMDTLQFSRKVYPHLPHHRLTDMVELLGLSNNEHRALADCIATHELYEHLKQHILQNQIPL